MPNTLTLKQLHIDTYKHAVIFMRKDSSLCRSEGFEVHARVRVALKDKAILATLYTVGEQLLQEGEAALSCYAWHMLNANIGDKVHCSHPQPLQSLSFVRSKIYNHRLTTHQIHHVIHDIAKGDYSDIAIAAFLTACAGGRLNEAETIDLTRAMVDAGQQLQWRTHCVVDKHSVGGIPGNRCTPIIVPIVTAYGMTMPKTSSRAITSPAGTADTMEVLTPVSLTISAMQQVVEKTKGCIVWGGSVELSPADDILIRVERTLELDSEGQLIASVLSKKIAAGSTHILIDIPVGPTAKIRTLEAAHSLAAQFHAIAEALGVVVRTHISDGSQPVGRGIGPALEARDVLQVLQNNANAPQDLRERALQLAGLVLEFSPNIPKNQGYQRAQQILDNGEAWQQFQKICAAQGGLFQPPVAAHQHTVKSHCQGRVTSIDNRGLSRAARLAGAPYDKAAGIDLHTPLDTLVEKNQPLFTIHAESAGELRYALSLLQQIPPVVQVEAYE